MEYVEMASLPKAVFDSLLATMSPSSTFREPPPLVRNGYRPMAVPLFHGGNTPSPVAVHGRPLPPTPTQNRAGFLQREMTLPLPSFPHLDERIAAEPPEASEAGPSPLSRQTNGLGGTNPLFQEKKKRKRVPKSKTIEKVGVPDPTVLLPGSQAASNATLRIVQPEVGLLPPPPKRRKPPSKADVSEKPPPRKRNRQSITKTNLKACQSEVPPNKQVLGKAPNITNSDPSKGILDVYGLETKPMDLTHHIREISLESLMSGDCQTNRHSRISKQQDGENSDGNRRNLLLQMLMKPSRTEFFHSREASVSGNQTSLHPKPVFDLESTPLIEDESPNLSKDVESKPVSYMAYAPCLVNQKNEETSTCPAEKLSIVHPIKFWQSLQLQPTESLETLLLQANDSKENSVLSPPALRSMGNICKSYTIPPLTFSTAPCESANEKITSMGMNRWFRAEPLKREPYIHVPKALKESSLSLIVECDKATTKHKEGLIDIDLNKQSPEAEAAEAFTHSDSGELKPEPAHPMSPQNDQMEVNKSQLELAQGNQQLDHSLPVKAEEGSNGSEREMTDTCKNTSSQKILDLQHKTPMKGEPNELGVVTQEAQIHKEVQRRPSPQANTCRQTHPDLPTLSVPSSNQNDENWNDVPCSPGVQATARLLCKMANSSSLFYCEKDDDGGKTNTFCSNTSMKQPEKMVRVRGPYNTDTKITKHSRQEMWGEEPLIRPQPGDGRCKQSKPVSNGPSPMKEKPNAKSNFPEPWTFTPPCSISKALPSRGSHSSETERRGVKENSCMEIHTKMSRKGDLHQHSSPPLKESKRSFLLTPKSNFLSAMGSYSPAPKETMACRVKQSSCGESLMKISRPRSNHTKSSLLSHKSSSYSVKPRTAIGSSVKTPARQMVSYVGEVRQGTK